jgi:hypothetical protein
MCFRGDFPDLLHVDARSYLHPFLQVIVSERSDADLTLIGT